MGSYYWIASRCIGKKGETQYPAVCQPCPSEMSRIILDWVDRLYVGDWQIRLLQTVTHDIWHLLLAFGIYQRELEWFIYVMKIKFLLLWNFIVPLCTLGSSGFLEWILGVDSQSGFLEKDVGTAMHCPACWASPQYKQILSSNLCNESKKKYVSPKL